MSASVYRCSWILASAIISATLQGVALGPLTVRESGFILQVWLTGHSLGGGYANAVVLHMLANRSCAELFAAGALSLTLPREHIQQKPFMYPVCAHSSVEV